LTHTYIGVRKGPPAVLVMFCAWAAMLVLALAALVLYRLLDVSRPVTESTLSLPILTPFFVIVITLMVLTEEIVFRFLPLSLTVWVTQGNHIAITIVVIISSFLFGWLHGGLFNVPIQGVGGVILSAVFLWCGGEENRPFSALFASTAVHWLYNATILAFMLASGITVLEM